MPIRRKHRNKKKYLFWAILIVLVLLMIISFQSTPEMTEIVLWP